MGYELLVKAGLLQLTAELLYQGLLLPTDPITLEASRNQRERMKKILTYLKQHMTEPLTLSSLADTFHMSEKYFSRYFFSSSGAAPAPADVYRLSEYHSDESCLSIVVGNG